MADSADPRPVCVIGAGASGLAAARVLTARGIPFEAFELGSGVGGIWRFRNDAGRSPAYASLETNTSAARTAFRGVPFPGDPAAYLGHDRVLAYLEAFADRFRLRERIRFRTAVELVRPAEGGYEITVRDLARRRAETRRARAVLVASGHHWDARQPELPGRFEGVRFHSRRYRSPEEPVSLAGRRVLVLGIGNSACDIACEAAGVASSTLLSTRRGAHVLPKTLFGRPLDQWITPLSSRLPTRLQALALGALVRLGRGDQRRFGVPLPDHRLGREHPTMSQGLPELVRAGDIEMRPDIASVDGRRIRFADGSEAEVDVIICATGYHVSFPFLDEGLLDRLDPPGPEAPARVGGRIGGNRMRLYRHVVSPAVPRLYFLGLIQPLGAIPPLAEAQAEWVADLLDGTGALPSPGSMRREIDAAESALARRFVRSPRHTLEVDFHPYLRALARERARGRRRARRSA